MDWTLFWQIFILMTWAGIWGAIISSIIFEGD